MIRNKGVCCIVLGLEERDPPLKFRTITYKSFSSLPREQALLKLGDVILNNLKVTEAAIRYCGERNFNYRLSSNIFPLMTYDKAELVFEQFAQLDEIVESMDSVKAARESCGVRLSTHPDQFNVLASDNADAVQRTFRELEFQGWFMSRIGCPEDYSAPMNIHVNRSTRTDDDRKLVRDLFYKNFEKLNETVTSRLVLENDDKPAGWTVKQLFDYFDEPRVPITFDYLHHKCHPGMGNYAQESQAFLLAHETWNALGFVPLFHYSESAIGSNNPRKHADYASCLPDTYEHTIDLDFEFKMKEKSFTCALENVNT
jgi:UV damage endonuclease UvdE